MAVIVIQSVLPICHVPGGHIYLAADDGFYTCRPAGLVKGHRAVHHAVIGYGKGLLAQSLGRFRNLIDAAGPIQQGKFSMYMQMNKGHVLNSFPSAPQSSGARLMIFLSLWDRQLFVTAGQESLARSARLASGLVMRSSAASFKGSGSASSP